MWGMVYQAFMKRNRFLIVSGICVVSCLLFMQYHTLIRQVTSCRYQQDPTIIDYSSIGGTANDSDDHVVLGNQLGGQFNDSHLHHDDTSVADELYKKVRVLCWIMTGPKNFRSKADVVKATWGRRCNVLLFMSSEADDNLQTIKLNVSEGRIHLTAKSMLSFQYVYDHFFHEADWFLKADDDTYVIVENLRYFLSTKNTTEPIFYGQHFSPYKPLHYNSGGAGYVLSKEALRRFANRKSDLCRKDGGSEDLEIGKCLRQLGVIVGNTTDSLGRTRFHCFSPEGHIGAVFPAWYEKYVPGYEYGGGIENISDYSVSFHYVKPNVMKMLEFYVYHLRPYGLIEGAQHIN